MDVVSSRPLKGPTHGYFLGRYVLSPKEEEPNSVFCRFWLHENRGPMLRNRFFFRLSSFFTSFFYRCGSFVGYLMFLRVFLK